MVDASEVSRLLEQAREGDREALSRLLPLVYQELRILARQRGRVGGGETLDTTALVHEAYLRLAGGGTAEWQDRGHFFAVASLAMRQILVDYARRQGAARRGGDRVQVELRDDDAVTPAGFDEVLAVHESLDRLAGIAPRPARVVELRYFGGLSVPETAEVLGVNERTVVRDWKKARAFLFAELDDGGPPAAPS